MMYKGAIDLAGLEEGDQKKLISELTIKADRWLDLSVKYQYVHWTIGTIGVLASALSASNLGGSVCAKICSVLSAVCIGVLGFLNPQKKSAQFLAAFRKLEPAIKTYRYADNDIKKVLAAHEQAEQGLNDSDANSKP